MLFTFADISNVTSTFNIFPYLYVTSNLTMNLCCNSSLISYYSFISIARFCLWRCTDSGLMISHDAWPVMMLFSLTVTTCSPKLGLDVCINYNHAYWLCFIAACALLRSENVVFPYTLFKMGGLIVLHFYICYQNKMSCSCSVLLNFSICAGGAVV